jgi:hypothetical protein
MIDRKLGIGLIGGMGRGAYVGKLFNETGDAEPDFPRQRGRFRLF